MYERFYRLRERPFALTPDLDYLYLSPHHRDALDHLRLGLEAGAGFVVLTGEIGCGKTTLLQTLVTSLDGRTLVTRLVYTLLEPAISIPFWKTIAGQVSQQTLQLNVVGTWDDPDVRPETLPGFNQALEQIQSEIQGATSVAPSTAERSSESPKR